MSLRILAEEEWGDWERFLAGIAESHFRQSSVYAAGLRLYGWRPLIVLHEEGGEPLAGALIGVKPIPLLGGCRMHVSGGIAVREGASLYGVGRFLDRLECFAREEGAVRLEVSWRRPYSVAGDVQCGGEEARALLRERGYQLLHPSGTYHVSLAGKSPETLLEGFGSYIRRYVRRGVREDFELITEAGPGALEEFSLAHRRMSARKRLTPLPSGFADNVLGPALERGQARFFAVRHGGTIRNVAIVSTVGAPFYSLGAVATAGEGEGNLPTAPYLHHGIMCGFLGHPSGYYDFGGSPGPEPEEGHPNYTVWQFKRRFNGDFVYHIGEWKKALRPRTDRLLATALRLRHGGDGIRGAGRARSG